MAFGLSEKSREEKGGVSTFINTLSALSTETGELLWKFTDEQRNPTFYTYSPTRSPRLLVSVQIYWRTVDTLYALKKETGEVAWQFETGATPAMSVSSLRFLFSPAPPALLSTGVLYVAAPNALVALDANTGEVRWKKDVPGLQPDADVASAGGLIYLVVQLPAVKQGKPPKTEETGFEQHRLYALRSDTGEVQ